MIPDPAELLAISGIGIPLIGFYDVPDREPFAPFATPGRCLFSAYSDWLKGRSVCISLEDTDHAATCQGGGYWVGNCLPQWTISKSGSRQEALVNFAKGLNRREGFKSSDELLRNWFENVKPYTLQHTYVVIGPLKDDQYKYLKTITFYVNPDQLSFLIHGAEYRNTDLANHPVFTAFGSGCGQMAALLEQDDDQLPRALIGATDMAMREHLPPDILAFTVNKPMYEQLCSLGENSFMHKHFWKRLRKSREEGKSSEE
jgi:hypothetical protein